jgi:hypothetical protein
VECMLESSGISEYKITLENMYICYHRGDILLVETTF